MVEGVEFGLNLNGSDKSDGEIVLGNLIQLGRELENLPLKLSRDVLNKHVFIAGVLGVEKQQHAKNSFVKQKFHSL